MSDRRRVVSSFDELLQPFPAGVNALCLARTLDADFDGLAATFAARADDEGGLFVLDEDTLRAAPKADPRALAVLLDDLRRLAALGREPQLNVLTRYPRDTRGLPITVDVHSFHADRAPVEADTFLCTYSGAASEGVDDADAVRLVDEPDVRAALRALHGRDEGFEAFLTEECFDLHFRPRPGATPYPFGVGNLWRISVAWPEAPVPPCIHRAPLPDGRPRLLLIS
ncbi:MAG: hypothetical protein ACOZQL_37160 [Myxococcota bacterium]